MTAQGEKAATAAQQQQGSGQEAIIARSETRVARTVEAIHGLGYASVAQALADYDSAVVAHAAMVGTSEARGSEPREVDQRTGRTGDPAAAALDDVVAQAPSHSVPAPIAPRNEGQARVRFVSAGTMTLQHQDASAPAGSPTASRRPARPPRKQGSLAGLWACVVGVAALLVGLMLLARPIPPASDKLQPAVPSSSEPVRTAAAAAPTLEKGPRAPVALPEATDPGSDSAQPEQPSAPTRQELSTAVRSIFPVPEADASPMASPAAPPVALSASAIPAPAAVENAATPAAPATPLLDLGQIEDAKRVQRRLIELGFLFGTPNGTWGPKSRKALREFRRAQGIGESDTWDLEAQQDLFSAKVASAPPAVSFVGGWGVNADQCRQTPDSPPVSIGSRRAAAFGATCQFNSTQRESANEWRIRATCADEHDHWNANIRLTLSGNRLTWTSERGTVTYLRCSRS